MHPACAGLLPRLLLWPRFVGQVQESLDKAKYELNAGLPSDEHATPRLLSLAKRKNGKWKGRLFPPPALHPAEHLESFNAVTQGFRTHP